MDNLVFGRERIKVLRILIAKSLVIKGLERVRPAVSG